MSLFFLFFWGGGCCPDENQQVYIVCVFPVPVELAPSAEYDQQVLQYEDWLNKQTRYLDVQVKMLEQQIQKQKRAKKTIQARQRQVSVACSFLHLLGDE